MRKLEKVSKVYGILRKFHAEHDRILDEKSVADFVSLGDRVGAAMAADDLARDEIAVKRHGRDVAFAAVQRSVLECKRAVEIVVIRDGRGVKVPHLTDYIGNPARIHILAGKYLVAAAQAGTDPAVVKAGASLKASLEAFVGLYNEAYDKVSATSEARKQSVAGLSSLTGEVNAYRMLFHARSSNDLRTELNNRIRVALPREKAKAESQKAAPVVTVSQPTVQPTALPALPTMPTAVPPSSEHPIVSANA